MVGSNPPLFAAVPEQWYQSPPDALVVGNGSFAATLAGIFRAEKLETIAINAAPQGNSKEDYPQVFGDLLCVFLVAGDEMSAAEVLRLHRMIWCWVEKLAPDGDQHELAFVFVLPPNASPAFETALAAGLSLPQIKPTAGHAIWRMSGSLRELVDLLGAIQPMDLLPLRARQAADVKRAALAELRQAVLAENALAVRKAAQKVLAVFSGQEYPLDVFCSAPSHQHGNCLRGWLRKVVTEEVTHEQWMEESKQLGNWLVMEITG